MLELQNGGNMIKIFEIPIYAISPSKLKIRVYKYISKLKKLLANLDTDMSTRVIDIQTFPMRNWDYNHIIGYINIAISKSDILFNVFMPLPTPKRYVWTTSKKIHVQNMCTNGTHLYLGLLKDNEEVREEVANMLSHVIDEHISARYYVDRAAFDIVNEHLDYMSIIQGVQNIKG